MVVVVVAVVVGIEIIVGIEIMVGFMDADAFRIGFKVVVAVGVILGIAVEVAVMKDFIVVMTAFLVTPMFFLCFLLLYSSQKISEPEKCVPHIETNKGEIIEMKCPR